jgi:catechol 2,3-dioxygenase-like lactoylglutathione lyase family enzyme
MEKSIVVKKLQHHVFYVKDLEACREFYTGLFNVQFSARNHQDSSAAMRMANQAMYFFSFGYYHHDICFVVAPKVPFDNDEMLHMTFVLRENETLAELKNKLQKRNIIWKEGRLIASAKLPSGKNAIAFPDPNGHWIEVIGN